MTEPTNPDNESGSLTIEVRNMSASYGAIQVLRDLSFTVPTGGVSVVLGANGAGKTTTLRAVCGGMGYFKTGGQVIFEGQDITRKDTADIVRMGLAHVPQGRGTFPELSTEDNMLAGAYIRRDADGIAEDLEKYYEMWPVLGERKDQAAGSLSGGEQQMLAVARALMGRPRVLLLDEPSLGLAPIIIQHLFETFAELNQETGVTMLLVEQNANLALKIGTYGYVLEAGAIVLEGPADQLRDDPAVQAAYLGS